MYRIKMMDHHTKKVFDRGDYASFIVAKAEMVTAEYLTARERVNRLLSPCFNGHRNDYRRTYWIEKV